MKPLNRALALISFLGFLLFTLAPPSALAQSQGLVLSMTVDGPVTPAMVSFIARGLNEAEKRKAEALIIRLNTPGGDVELTKRIVQEIIASDIPVIVYVYPPGAFAASAGTLITLAGHAAAMAPNTSIGAASPIGANPSSGQPMELPETLRAKTQNILVADIEGLARRRGEKALEWARQAITEARAADANEALSLGVVDFIATDTEELLAKLDGFTVEVRGHRMVIHTAGVNSEEIQRTFSEEFLQTIANPNIAFLLLSIGTTALILELSNPGGYIAGVVGVIMLIMAFYALGTLPVNYAGLLFIALAFILFIAEVKAPTHGVLTLSGIISLSLGAIVLFNTPYDQISISLVLTTALAIGGFFAFVITKALAIQRRRPTTGKEGLIGKIAIARSALAPIGIVFILGERWEAIIEDGTVEPGTEVTVVAVDGMRLRVRKKEI